MRHFVRNVALFGALLCAAAASAVAATPSDFYLNLLRRGVAAFDAERYGEATDHLKIAAFGFVDSIEHYQTAQIYLALAYDRQENAEKARDAARRVIAAERIERKYAKLVIPAGVADSFDVLARKLLTSAEAAFLGRAPVNATPPPSAAVAQKKPATPPPQSPPAETPKAPAASNNGKAEPENKPAEKPPVETRPAEKAPVVAKPQPQQTPPPAPAPKAQTPAPQIQTAPHDVAARFAAAERALAASELPEARAVYRGLLETPGISRDDLIRAGEGLYRSRDFEGALAAFTKIGTLRRGEEPYHYYIAVSYYETGRYEAAKTELAAALPYIEITPDVAQYRAKIDGTND